tara:strand:- start:153 stop:674 length:522 start_codon:yes stop_codon:yes gene_type:complete
MKHTAFLGLVFFVITSISGCAAIQSHRNLEQPIGLTLSTGVGGTIFRLNKVGDLPNAFGGRDIYGGKTDKGFAEVKLTEIDGTVLTLEVVDISKNATETVMDRYKPFQNRNSMNLNVSASVSLGGKNELKPYITKVDTAKQSYFIIAGIRVTFTDVNEYGVQYTIEDMMAGLK